MKIEISTAVLSAIFAGVSALCALWGYFSERKIRQELKADENIMIGKPHNPSFISLTDHRDCVLEIPIYNISMNKRVFITKVQTFNRKRKPVEISWSGSTDNLGNISAEGNILKIDDCANLYIRANDGECIDYLSIKLFHTFSDTARTIIFDKYADLHE